MNKVITYLIVDAFIGYGQDLDDTEDIEVHLYDFDEMGTALKESKIKTQLFTAYAYYMAKAFLAEKSLQSSKKTGA